MATCTSSRVGSGQIMDGIQIPFPTQHCYVAFSNEYGTKYEENFYLLSN